MPGTRKSAKRTSSSRSSPSSRGSPRDRGAKRTSSRTSARTAGRNGTARRARAGRDGQVKDVVSLLRQQHDLARRTFQELAAADAGERRELFPRLADLLAAHSALEEQLLYPELAQGELEEFARDSLEEHLIVKRLLSDLLEKELDERVFDAKCRVLEIEVLKHVDEEESLFPRMTRALGRGRSASLLPEMQQKYEELMRSEPRRSVPSETDHAPMI